MHRRSELLDQLARYDGPSAPILEELRSMGWDWSGEPLLVLSKAHFLGVMDRYLAGSVSAEQLEEWAENLEQREDVTFSPEAKDALDEVLFCLANPSINLGISNESVRKLREQVTGA
jgi:hypothetical protein